MTVANLCVYKSKKHYNPRYIHKVKLKAEFKFQKFLPLGVPFQFTIMIWKNSVKLNPLIQNNVQQDYLVPLQS